MRKTSRSIYCLLLVLIGIGCASKDTTKGYESETLKIIPISENSFVHVSYLNTESFGKVACNGLIYMNNGEAVVFDTPADHKTTRELIDWLENDQRQHIKGLVVSHFHVDALGGISEFHVKNIATYGHRKTSALVNAMENRPVRIFDEQLMLKVGQSEIVNGYFGEAHTVDNIVSHIPDEQLLYGGCMIKSLNAGKGNLEDANIEEWSKTVLKIKVAYPGLKTVVPGHGNHGGAELLDFTIKLFKTN